jgi:hypothetical protein
MQMGETGALRRSGRLASAALLCLGLLVAIGAETSDLAEAKKKKVNRRVGTYRGVTEEGGPVSFRITKNRRVVDFTVPNARLTCFTRSSPPGGEPEYDKGTVTITAPAMPLQGAARFLFEVPINPDAAFQGIHVDGKPDPGQAGRTGLKGNAVFLSWSAPRNQAGTEVCGTTLLDWTANKVGRKRK